MSSLVENAKTKSQEHLLAITKRKSLAETVTDVLVERGDRDVALSVAQNAGAKFSETGYRAGWSNVPSTTMSSRVPSDRGRKSQDIIF